MESDSAQHEYEQTGPPRGRALLVEDRAPQREALRGLVGAEGFTVTCAGCVAEAREALQHQEFDVLLLDLQLPDGSSLPLLAEAEKRPAMAVVLVTGHGSVDSAVAAFRRGAADYLTKPVDVQRLRAILRDVHRRLRARRTSDALRAGLRSSGCFGPLLGSSPAMQRVYDHVEKVAPTDTTVLVVGETGTGKELVAETLHAASRRAGGPLLPLNCGAVAPGLIESELFGHERGSFTGAVGRHAGLFERAHGGTLFLDEITEMPLALQVKLLRALETRQVQRVGGDEPLPVDVRVIAATNRRPRDAVSEGRLRRDLLYRLAVFPIELPPLRERGGDLEALTDHFLAGLQRREGARKRLTDGAREALRRHAWPGNVRELKHALERAFILAPDDITPEHLPLGAPPARPAGRDDLLDIHVGMSDEEAERVLTLATLARYGQKNRTAEVLGISLKTLYNRLKRYETHGVPGAH